MKKIQLMIIAALGLTVLPPSVFANELEKTIDTDPQKVVLVIERGQSVKSALTDFVKEFDFEIKWAADDFISGYRVIYEAKTPVNLLREFVNDTRENGKLIKATVYKNNVLVVENESK
jgi:hypothetical protein